MDFVNSFHPYLFLREVYPADPAALFIIVVAHELDARDCLEDITAIGEILKLNIAVPVLLPDNDAVERVLTLMKLADGQTRFVITTPYGLEKETWSKENLLKQRLNLALGEKLSREELVTRLVELGFSRADVVESAGEFAIRGQVLDFYPPSTDGTQDYAIRVLFEFDQIDSIRLFDVASQESVKFVTRVEALGVKEEPQGSLLQLAPPKTFLIFANDELKGAPKLSETGFREFIFGSKSLEAKTLPVIFNPSFQGNLGLFLEEAAKLEEASYEIKIVSSTVGEEERFQELAFPKIKNKRPHLNFHLAKVSHGFQDQERKLWVVTAHEIFARTAFKFSRPPIVKKTSKTSGKSYFEKALLELKSGDIVVHETYGISKYRGIQEVLAQDGTTFGELLCLEFAKRDKLYMSVEDFHFIHKFVSLRSQKAPRLSSLDKRRFDTIKEEVREEIRLYCQELLKLYAKRVAQERLAFGGGHHWEEEFAKSFGYEETPDQQMAIESALSDMASAKPMERLILGDVGFGKTEVALRASMRAVMNSKQVALLAPTTILAEQHFRTFEERFEAYPVRLALFSRFQKRCNIIQQLKDLEKGLIDIAIGTHRILQKDVAFKDLGLLIIDEEHRFGVRDKEKLKFLAAHADALSLSATPIPRTLASSLSGFKEISVIESPPVGRLKIETHIGPWDKELLRRAISYEISRQGQVFYVLNEIKRLGALSQELEGLVPGMRTGICHGQMRASEIERVMHKFLNKEIDVLVVSSIIESGLDIPSVNTLVIEEAQDFGVSQLYQLRGRIGRSRLKAYCYFFYPRGASEKDLSAQARERLDAIREFSEMGSAMRLALRDLEIRGAGEFLGTRQHGFVSRIGLELYTKLLNEEMEKIKTPQIPITSFQWPKVALSLPAYLTKELLPSETERITYYRRLSQSLNEGELDEIFKELEDRCGRLPQETLNLKLLFQIRILARRLHLVQLEEVEASLFRFEFRESQNSHGQFIAWLLSNFKDRLQFEHDKSAFRLKDLKTPESVLEFLENAVNFS